MQKLTPQHISNIKRGRGRPPKVFNNRDEGNRRIDVILAAAKLFKEKGFAATSTREIAALAGMQSGSPFYHFENKQALLHAVVEEGLRRALESQKQQLSKFTKATSAREQLQLLIQAHFHILLGSDSDFIPVMLYNWRFLNNSADIRQLKNQYESAWLSTLETLSKEGQLSTPVAISRLLIMGALNWVVQWYQPPANPSTAPQPRLTPDELTQIALALFLKG